ncbi:hypothetical protein K431DRAFT_216362 [Polychaeton citri CBS 116435]|uniref:Zn(2)-C6 fungal-type domain-containing protein n=1 Tax=Polychaeton citri CBS 116435 TaxID=1314669 RepID=A0A9P4QHS4_9PEZI|nr:hypothetical protein K431DRAFT_216362 [Polychaeton citri CBS 116435]
MDAPKLIPSKRRNGQLSSCESCRKSKMRCDHEKPSCGRCIRRGTSESCFYHPAPMTKLQKTQGDVTPSTSQERASSSLSPRLQNGIDRGTGLVSMTSIALPLLRSDRAVSCLTRTGVSTPARRFAPNPHLIAEGEQIVQLLNHSFTALNGIIKRWDVTEGGICAGGPAAGAAWHSIGLAYQRHLPTPASPDQLREFTLLLFDNTSKPLSFPSNPEGGKLTQVLCDGIRWETVGLFFVIVGMAVSSVENSDRFFSDTGHTSSDRKTIVRQMLDTSLACERFCDRLSQVNDLTVILLSNATILATWSHGDDSLLAWRVLSNLMSVAVALGLHLGCDNDGVTPRYLVEIRRRSMCLAFETDQGLAIFTGRPARLSRRFFTLELPADVPEADILAAPEQLEKSIAAVDANGWNMENKMYFTTRVRAGVLLAIIQAEVLELSLSRISEGLEEQAQKSLQKSNETWRSLPAWICSDDLPIDDVPAINVSCIVGLKLSFLYNQFLLYKMLVNRTRSYRASIIEVSHRVVQIILSAAQRREVLGLHRVDLEWMAVCHAMPCASVLTLELLHQTQHPDETLPVSRAAIIRDLSVFISCCDRLTEPGEGNYELCKRAQSIFSRGLDQALNYVPVSTASAKQSKRPTPHPDHVHHKTLDNPSLPAADQDDALPLLTADPEFSAWLNDFDVHIDPWIEMLEQPTAYDTTPR